jgi:hypothetical protein
VDLCFVDKTPRYPDGEDDPIWIAYVDAERTLQGFKTFLDQYRVLLASLPSGVQSHASSRPDCLVRHHNDDRRGSARFGYASMCAAPRLTRNRCGM